MTERKVSAQEQAIIEKAHKNLPGGSLGNMFAPFHLLASVRVTNAVRPKLAEAQPSESDRY